jgi:flavodoxin
MKVLVAYYSQTGNTKKVAQAISEVIKTDKNLMEIKDIDSLEDYDLVFAGFPLHYGRPAKAAKNFLEKHAQGKKVALFVTHATREDSEGLQKWLARCKKVVQDAELVGFFNCQGNIDTARLNRASDFAAEILQKLDQQT